MVEVSREDVLALMPFKNLDKILGTPTFENMIILRKQLGANLIAVDCPHGQQKGQLGLLQDPAISQHEMVEPTHHRHISPLRIRSFHPVLAHPTASTCEPATVQTSATGKS